MALLARQLYFEAVKVGDELPPLVKPPVDRTQIARYAGASGDFNPLYVDEHLAKNAGFPSAHSPGMLVMGFIGELAVDWLRGARLRRFTSRFVKIVWPGDVITCRGRVVDRRFEGSGVYAIDIEVFAENQRGELVLKGLITAQLYYSSEDDARQRAGQPPLVVTPEEEEARLAKLSRAQPPKRQEPHPPPPPRPAPARAAQAQTGLPPPAGSPHPPAPTPAPGRSGANAPHSAAVAAPRQTAAAAIRPAAPAVSAPASPARAPGPARPAVPARRTKAARPAPPPRRPAGKTRSVPRAVPKAKPAARASRPRAGSKPTGKKRR
jgi:acyl dehydratase